MSQREIIESERLKIYNALKSSIELGMEALPVGMKRDYCLSWWINTRNYDWKVSMPSSKINQRCRLLVRHGFLTAKSYRYGTEYRLTGKVFTGDLNAPTKE